MREALFNALSARLDFDGAAVLDLYAGSGALGLEALSRGAATVLFVDSDRRAADVIARNIATVGLAGAVVRRGQVGAVLAGGAPHRVDLVLADPPYDLSDAQIDAVPAALAEHGWVGRDSVVVVERPVSARSLAWPSGWTAWPVRRYGDTRLEVAEVG